MDTEEFLNPQAGVCGTGALSSQPPSDAPQQMQEMAQSLQQQQQARQRAPSPKGVMRQKQVLQNREQNGGCHSPMSCDYCKSTGRVFEGLL